MSGGDFSNYDVRRVMSVLPHRYPMLLVDRVEELIVDERICAVKAVSMNEGFFQGHFPGRPSYAGRADCRGTGASRPAFWQWKAFNLVGSGKLVYFMSIDNAKFRVPVEPGCLLHLNVEFVQKRPRVCKFAGKAMMGDQVAAEAEFMAMIADPPA